METPRPVKLFWAAAGVDILTLGIAWSAAQTTAATRWTLVVGVSAMLICAAATLIALRVLVVLSRKASDPP